MPEIHACSCLYSITKNVAIVKVVSFNYGNLFMRCYCLLVGGTMAHNSCSMCTCGLSNMYTLDPQASGVHIRQTTGAHVTTIITYVIQSSNNFYLCIIHIEWCMYVSVCVPVYVCVHAHHICNVLMPFTVRI